MRVQPHFSLGRGEFLEERGGHPRKRLVSGVNSAFLPLVDLKVSD